MLSREVVEEKAKTYQEEIKGLQEKINYYKNKSNRLQEKIDKINEELKLLILIGVDYDGYNQVDGLKSLIDELLGYAEKCGKIINEEE